MAQPNHKEIIAPVSKDVLISELTKDKFIRTTNYGENEIYVITHHNAPNVMREIGRLREMSFRLAGGGTGKDTDIDSYDTAENPYYQLIVWEPRDKEIIGGYRFINCSSVPKDDTGNIKLATTGMFKYSEEFIEKYLPWTIELGRSFVTPKYQAKSAGRKAMYSLDNLWDGLGAIALEIPTVKYFTGKITMYVHFDKFARDLILYFFNKYFFDDKKLMEPKEPLGLTTDLKILSDVFNGNDYDKDYRTLSKMVRERNEAIPPMFNSYMNLSPTMKVFGTATNHNFGGVEETGIMLTLEDIYEKKKERHISTYTPKGLTF